MKYNKPELLSPAGSYDAFIAAIHAGCDAVYLGGIKFGARARAENFSNDLLIKAIDYAHLNNVKVYYTANTLIKDNELEGLFEQIYFLYREGIDAIILQDLGAYHMIHNYFPKLPLHASTQMTIHSLNGALFTQNLGFERVVLSRELSLQEIQYIGENSNIELECFIHGALCYCYSGQCLFSSIIGGRSGNRGSCAQPCRLPYDLIENNKLVNHIKHKYLLSPKDIQTLDILPQLIRSKIHSFKIEGRMKNSNYVGLITSLYRKYIDLFFENPNNYKLDKNDILDMHQIYNRGGFSNGYYFLKNGKKMMCISGPNHQGVKIGKVSKIIDKRSLILELNKSINQGDCIEITTQGLSNYSFIAKETISGPNYNIFLNTKSIREGDLVYKITDVDLIKRIEEDVISKDKKIPVNILYKAVVGEKSYLNLIYKNYNIEVVGNIVESAKTSATSKEKISLQLCKTGESPVIVEKIDLHLDDNIFISIKEINSMRRKAIELLIRKILEDKKRDVISKKYNKSINVNPLNKHKLTNINVLIRNISQFEIIKNYPINNIYLELNNFKLKEIEEISIICKKLNYNLFAALPKIIRQDNLEDIINLLNDLKDLNIKGVLIRSLDAYELVKDSWDIILDYSINIFNNEVINFWEQQNIKQIGVSLELNSKEISMLNGKNLEMLIYGFIPLMTSAQCLSSNNDYFCGNKSVLYLKDRKNIQFKVIRDCKTCLNTIYNSVPLVLIDKYEELKDNGIQQFRLDFLDEKPEDINTILNYTFEVFNKKSLSSYDFNQINALKNYTRGHFTRGVK